jgi:hypothetical protein
MSTEFRRRCRYTEMTRLQNLCLKRHLFYFILLFKNEQRVINLFFAKSEEMNEYQSVIGAIKDILHAQRLAVRARECRTKRKVQFLRSIWHHLTQARGTNKRQLSNENTNYLRRQFDHVQYQPGKDLL